MREGWGRGGGESGPTERSGGGRGEVESGGAAEQCKTKVTRGRWGPKDEEDEENETAELVKERAKVNGGTGGQREGTWRVGTWNVRNMGGRKSEGNKKRCSKEGIAGKRGKRLASGGTDRYGVGRGNRGGRDMGWGELVAGRDGRQSGNMYEGSGSAEPGAGR